MVSGPEGVGMERRNRQAPQLPVATHTILEALPIGVLVTDTQGMVVLVNPAAIHHLHLPEETVAGRPLASYIPDETLQGMIMRLSAECGAGGGQGAVYEFSVDGDTFLQARSRPLIDPEGRCLGAVVTVMDVTAMKVLDRLKGEFVAKVSHELRSPLSTIHEQLAMLLGDLVGTLKPPEEHLLSRAKEKTHGLIALVGDLLDLSRIESGAVCDAPRAVQLEELLENIIAFMGTKAAAKRQAVQMVRPPDPLPAVQADPLALESIFGNLIANAINYTPDGGTITVSMDRSGALLRVCVRDTGFGIEARHLDKIFHRFYRVKTEKTRYITGTGLGLPIVKGLVDALGGRIEVDSIPDEGSTFTVWLPIDG